jgi:hypothetical protein
MCVSVLQHHFSLPGSEEVLETLGSKLRVPTFLSLSPLFRRRDSSVGIGTRLRAERLWSRTSIPGGGKRVFSYSQRPHQLWSPPSLLWVPEAARLREAAHSAPCSAEVKIDGVISAPPNTSSWHGA